MNIQLNAFVKEAIKLPIHAIQSAINWHIRETLSELALLETSDSQFDVTGYAAAGHCQMNSADDFNQHVTSDWNGDAGVIIDDVETGLFDVSWADQKFTLLRVSWPETYCSKTIQWVLGADHAGIRDFFQTVCKWRRPVTPTIWVFEDGRWSQSQALYNSIKSSTLDNLILAPGLKEELKNDLSHFFSSKSLYDQYGIPWKRGVLLTGSPGNGKTHAVKALVNWLGKPALYVRSIKSSRHTDHTMMHQVFSYARMIAPCIVVLEDLETIVTPQNRSYFLNELDGFALNTGILAIATSNHPEQLDPAITERPSRFDRKYAFDLPAINERQRYLAAWNEIIEADLKLSGTGLLSIATDTDGFSFAFLKELIMASLMRWINVPDKPSMDEVMTSQMLVLRSQMSTMNSKVREVIGDPSTPSDDYEEE